MTQDLFGSLFDLQDSRLKQLGNPLLELEKTIDWESFCPLLDKIHEKERKNQAGAAPKDIVMMFKGLVIQNMYGLSDDQLEYQIEDRRSVQQFLGLSNHQCSPDAKTFCSFKNQLSTLNLMAALFQRFSVQLN